MNSVDYHFIISSILYQFLERIARRSNQTVNMLIRRFVSLTICHIDLLYQNYGRQVKSGYEPINLGDPLPALSSSRVTDGTLDENVDIHILFSGATHYKLKWLQGNFNLFSMAQVVRKCIFFMLRMIEEYGTLEYAIKALEGMDEAIEELEDSKDERGFIQFHEGIRHMMANSEVSYGIVALYIRFMKFIVFGLPPSNK